MHLSQLQKYILLQTFDAKNRPSRQIMVNSITSSLERLIKKGLIIGYGEFTQFKNFIYKIKLTPLGLKMTKKMLGEQRRLPLKLKLNN